MKTKIMVNRDVFKRTLARKCLNQTQLAEKMNMGDQNLSMYVNGKSALTRGTAERFCDALSIDFDKLFYLITVTHEPEAKQDTLGRPISKTCSSCRTMLHYTSEDFGYVDIPNTKDSVYPLCRKCYHDIVDNYEGEII